MKSSNRHNKILNRLLAILLGPFLRLIFGFSYKKNKLTGPTLVVSNHVTNFDPLLVSICFPKDHMHFVASEHLFRKGFVTKFLRYVFDPIPRRKGTSGADTAMACMRKLKEGRSVCLFAEGECTWDGVTNEIFPATGRLARMANATLITFRLEGGYLTAPRWGKGVRRGKMTGRIMGIYTPEDLKAMDKNAITGLIQRDIFEDTWENQAKAPVRYRHRRRAENLQTVLYGCPKCNRIGHLSTKKSTLSCDCGASWTYTELGTFAPTAPFENIRQWDTWQRTLLSRDSVLSDPDVTVMELLEAHQQLLLAQGDLKLAQGKLCCGDLAIPLEEIDDMALVQSRILLVSVGSRYYQFRAKKPACLRKYLAVWKNCTPKSPVTAE